MKSNNIDIENWHSVLVSALAKGHPRDFSVPRADVLNKHIIFS
jgi:hypothetical protein